MNARMSLPGSSGGTTSPDQDANMAGRDAAKTVDELLARARGRLPERVSPAGALSAQASGALLVDIAGDDQRRDGLIPALS